MLLIDFVKSFDEFTYVVFEFYWEDGEFDEEYSFEGSVKEFIQNYTVDYDCIDGYNIFDLNVLSIRKEGIRRRVCMELVHS